MVACKFLCFEKTGPWVEVTVVQHIVNVQCKQTTNEFSYVCAFACLHEGKRMCFAHIQVVIYPGKDELCLCAQALQIQLRL